MRNACYYNKNTYITDQHWIIQRSQFSISLCKNQLSGLLFKLNPPPSFHQVLNEWTQFFVVIGAVVNSVRVNSFPSCHHFWSAAILDHQLSFQSWQSFWVEKFNWPIDSLLKQRLYEFYARLVLLAFQNKHKTHNVPVACPFVVLLCQFMQLFHCLCQFLSF